MKTSAFTGTIIQLSYSCPARGRPLNEAKRFSQGLALRFTLNSHAGSEGTAGVLFCPSSRLGSGRPAATDCSNRSSTCLNCASVSSCLLTSFLLRALFTPVSPLRLTDKSVPAGHSSRARNGRRGPYSRAVGMDEWSSCFAPLLLPSVDSRATRKQFSSPCETERRSPPAQAREKKYHRRRLY
jgi:hypothetical protein